MEKISLNEKQTEKICEALRNTDLSLITAETYEGKELWNPDDVKSIDYKPKENARINLRRDYSYRWGDIYQYTLTLSQDDNRNIYKYESMNGGIHGGADLSYTHLCLAYTFKNIAERITAPVRRESYKKTNLVCREKEMRDKQELEDIIKNLI